MKKALDSGEAPHALLCDIYFYDDESEREQSNPTWIERGKN